MRKLRPSNYWNMGKIESWLSDMVAEGYFLQTMDSNFCDFKEDEPKAISFRIEIAENGKNLSQKQRLKYKEDLWSKVTNYKKFYVFSCPSEFVASEPNPSPEVLGKSLKPIFYKTILKLFILLLAPILIIRFLPYLTSSSVLISTLKGTVLNITPYALYIWIILSFCINAYFQWKLIRVLSKSVPINHHAPWKKTYWISSALWTGKILLITVIILSPIILSQILLPHLVQKPLSAETTPVPIIRLEDVETADGSDFDKTLFKNGYYSKGIGILAPKQIYSREYGNPTDNYYTSIDNEYYKLTFPKTQKLIVNALVDRLNRTLNELNSTRTSSLNPEVIENEYMDYLVYGYDSILLNHHVFASF